jgi:c-di-GMP-binding flagellar brake protein YcgR
MEKDYDGSEKRKFKRDLISYKIADISAGGLRFILPRGGDLKVSIGDTFFLHEIKGKSQLKFVADIELEVKWTMDHEMFEHIMMGCEFVTIAEDVRKQFDRFVESELAQQNQDS